MDYLAECICFSLMVIDTAHILDELSNLIMCTMTIGFPQCNYINWSTQVSDLDQMIGIQNVAFDDANKTWLQTSSNNTIPFVLQVILWLKYSLSILSFSRTEICMACCASFLIPRLRRVQDSRINSTIDISNASKSPFCYK